MIIECPACTTRYDIKATLPPEGRTVRCAKCGTVWRAMPENGAEEMETSESAWVAPSNAGAVTAEQAAVEQAVQQFAAVGHAHDNQWAPDTDSTSATYEEAGATEEPSREEDSIESHPASEPESDASANERSTGKVSWFSSFRRKKKLKEKDEAAVTGEADGAPPAATAETIPFPRAAFPGEPQAPAAEERTLEAAREAVRGVFSSLGDGRAYLSGRAIASPVTATGVGSDYAESELRTSETHSESDWTNSSERESAAEASDLANWARSVDAKGWDTIDRESEGVDGWQGLDGKAEAQPAGMDGTLAEADMDRTGEEDSDAALRDAMRAHFPSTAPKQELAEQLETHLRAAGAPVTAERVAPRSIAGLWRQRAPRVDEEMTEPGAVVEEETAESKDDDASFDQRLYREIEETQEKSGEVPRRTRRGGLALAAAWGLFLCVAAGLVVGFFAFRDITADALPGLAPLYRALGMPVTVQPLNFESVQYKWTVSENRPVLVVSGSVYNRAQRKVRVPEFYITVKDQDPALDREYSANLRINSSKIKSNQHADFDIELVSPSPTLTSVELELRNVH